MQRHTLTEIGSRVSLRPGELAPPFELEVMGFDPEELIADLNVLNHTEWLYALLSLRSLIHPKAFSCFPTSRAETQVSFGTVLYLAPRRGIELVQYARAELAHDTPEFGVLLEYPNEWEMCVLAPR